MDGKQCKKCNHINSYDSNFCIRCGTPLLNICSNPNCSNCQYQIELSDDAAFCPLCGAETVFNKYGLTTSPFNFREEDLPF